MNEYEYNYVGSYSKPLDVDELKKIEDDFLKHFESLTSNFPNLKFNYPPSIYTTTTTATDITGQTTIYTTTGSGPVSPGMTFDDFSDGFVKEFPPFVQEFPPLTFPQSLWTEGYPSKFNKKVVVVEEEKLDTIIALD